MSAFDEKTRAERKQKQCVVSGATSGIGLHVARGLASKGHRVVMLGRDETRLRRAVDEVRAYGSANAIVVPVLGDLATVESSRRAAASIRAELSDLHVLVHCAGIWATKKQQSADGFESSFAVNHLAPFVLNEVMLPLLLQSAAARIVQVSAGLYAKGVIDLDGDPDGTSFHPLRSYATTKLWNLLATMDLARTTSGSSLTVNAVHPGVVRTNLGQMNGPAGLVLRAVKQFWMTPDKGARAPLFLALAPDIARMTGRYFDERRETGLLFPANDMKLARDVVARTQELLRDR